MDTRPDSRPIVLLPGEGEQIADGPTTIVMKATAATTNGAFSIAETTFPPGAVGPPPHTHQTTTDTFYVLEGTLRIYLADAELDAPAGTYALVPPGVTHTFGNPSDAPVRFLNINAPGGWEHYLRDLAAAMAGGAMPGSADFARVIANYDIQLPTTD